MIIHYTQWRRPVNQQQRLNTQGRHRFRAEEHTVWHTWQQGQRTETREIDPEVLRDYYRLVRLFSADNTRRRAKDL